MMNIKRYNLTIEVVTGLTILSGIETFEIGGLDRTVIRIVYKYGNKELKIPFIPGSSLKGKISSLLEKKYFSDILKIRKILNIIEDLKNLEDMNVSGEDLKKALKRFDDLVIVDESSLEIVDNLNSVKNKIDQFFKIFEAKKNEILQRLDRREENILRIINILEEYKKEKDMILDRVSKIDKNLLIRFLKLFRSMEGVVLIFEDLYPTNETIEYWEKVREKTYDLGTEVKYENVIDRLTGKAQHPRLTERVIPGSKFTGNIIYIVTDERELEENLKLIEEGLKLLEDSSYLGSSGSRGYGRIKINLQKS